MAEPPSLAELQKLLTRLFIAPEGAAEELKGDRRAAQDVARTIRSDVRLSAVERLEVYAQMYFFRLRDIIAADFPKLAAALGEVALHNLMVRFLSTAPSRHPSVAKLGGAFCHHLMTHSDSEPPWLADLAALEWARVSVFDRADAEPIDLETLQNLAPEEFADHRLRLVPAHEIVRVEFSVDELWSALDSNTEENLPPPAAVPKHLLVWREGYDSVYHRSLEPLESQCLVLLTKGASFSQVCELVMTFTGDEEAPAHAFSLLQRWVSDQLLTDPS
jgi:hypothetical protein